MRQLPISQFPGGSILDCHKVKKAVLDWDEEGTRAPDLFAFVDLHSSAQIREERILGMRVADPCTLGCRVRHHFRLQMEQMVPANVAVLATIKDPSNEMTLIL